MSDYEGAYEELKMFPKSALEDECTMYEWITDNYITTQRALKIAEAVEKDLADGWVMVPREATDEHDELFHEEFKRQSNHMKDVCKHRNIPYVVALSSGGFYKAAINAAPKSQTEIIMEEG